MNLDLRIPLGMMFSFTGAILAIWGIQTNHNTALYARSLGINANLWWGLVLLAFGVTMYVLGQRGQRKLEKEPPAAEEKGKARRGH
jgi:hypothetical protein